MPFANKEDERAYRRKYYMLNQKKIKDRAKKNYEDNTDKRKSQTKEYRSTDAGKKTVAKSRAEIKQLRHDTKEVSIDHKTYYKRWELAEDTQLLTLKEKGATNKDIALILHRTYKAIEARYNKLLEKNEEN